MIIYRSQEQLKSPSQYLDEIRALLCRLEHTGFADHEDALELLMVCGEYESSAADALCAGKDTDSPTLQWYREITVTAGRIFCSSWRGSFEDFPLLAGKLHRILDEPAVGELPEFLRCSVPEGYAYYGLYPETYLEAAEICFDEVKPTRVVCLGIRSIGTSLSGVVSAVMRQRGCDVRAYTVRPRGHPFDRRLLLSPSFSDELRSMEECHFLVIDEGPGLSGSSLCCVAERLSELGIADGRIALFPSWCPDGTGFVSEKARKRWVRHPKYTATFERVWLDSGRLMQPLPFRDLMDISAGMWRRLFYNDPSLYPAVHGHHERRKYVCSEAGNISRNNSLLQQPSARVATGRVLLKFAGLGKYGKAAYDRAKILAEAGYGPPVLGLKNGFLVMELLAGKPVAEGEAGGELLDRVAMYLAFLKRSFPADRGASHAELSEMIRVNIQEGLGEMWMEKTEVLLKSSDEAQGGLAVAIDGRMMPHEWFLVRSSYLKTDGVDHHNDHFMPGCQDIAWDVAGCCIEFGLDRKGRDRLVQSCRHLLNDDALTGRMPFYTVAYLSYRLGYATTASNALRSCDDGGRFAALTGRYAALLKDEITCQCARRRVMRSESKQ